MTIGRHPAAGRIGRRGDHQLRDHLSVDKAKVINEMFRVLSRGGRIGISDVVAEDHLSVEARAERGSYVGRIAGALSRQEYLDALSSADFTNPTVRFTHQTANGMHSAIIQATKPERSARSTAS